MDIIHTDRLELKPMCMDYLYSTHEYASDPENTKYMLFLPNESIEETKEYLEGAEKEFKKNILRFMKWLFFTMVFILVQ